MGDDEWWNFFSSLHHSRIFSWFFLIGRAAKFQTSTNFLKFSPILYWKLPYKIENSEQTTNPEIQRSNFGELFIESCKFFNMLLQNQTAVEVRTLNKIYKPVVVFHFPLTLFRALEQNSRRRNSIGVRIGDLKWNSSIKLCKVC